MPLSLLIAFGAFRPSRVWSQVSALSPFILALILLSKALMNILGKLCLLGLGAGTLLAQSQLPNASWNFTQTYHRVSQYEAVPIYASITVDLASPAALFPTAVGATSTGELQKTFQFGFGDVHDAANYAQGVQPGQTLTLLFGTFYPIGGRAAEGIYPPDQNFYSLNFFNPETFGSLLLQPGNSFTIEVVPEPATLSLAAFGLIAFGFSVRPERKSSGA
jgi:hypothetical protein